ncbi:hypothetical protein TNCV_4202861 [Trichonephila clavipes]|uniref:Uncharacterized protein n=1 Tax=Trichonephila clavipes TaxID=2585209 RepID=A0A8X6S961_TRICX|nr:hypothetical protein TNCV_4202861 [Trichonephila clavipes]
MESLTIRPGRRRKSVSEQVIATAIVDVSLETNVGISAGLSIVRLEGAQEPGAQDTDKLDLTRFSGYKFRSTSTKRACKSSAPRARNELKSALIDTNITVIVEYSL